MKIKKLGFVMKSAAVIIAMLLTLTLFTPAPMEAYAKTKTAASVDAFAATPAAQAFDALYYAVSYPDVYAVYGLDETKLFNHYIKYGIKEGRNANAYFNALAYKAANPDLALLFGDHLLLYAVHYETYGRAEGRLLSASPDGTQQIDTALIALLNLVNAERAAQGLTPLIYDANLTAAAQLRVTEIKTLFSHTRPDGSGCFTAFTAVGATGAGYGWKGENLATGFTDAASVFKAWMESPGHRDNIMRPEFNKIGMAKDGAYWTQAFGG